MKNVNNFFKKKNKISLYKILNLLGLKTSLKHKKIYLKDIKVLESADKNDLSFLHSSKYLNQSNISNAKFILTSEKYSNKILKKSKVIIVKNVLLNVAKITQLFYSESLNDNFDKNLSLLKKKNNFKNLTFGKNIFLGKNVKIGKNCSIGYNTIIESNVRIGNNCKVGSNVIIKNSLIGNNVNILDGAVIGKKGFGFFPGKEANIRYPHIGMVVIGDNVEIGCNNTIDRGSLSNTVIGDNSFLDNQVHIAHNVRIGKNCLITAQVGFAGSSNIGDRVLIGGQAGISGHLNVGDDVKIAGGSGVVKDIPDNTKVMGYPAKDIRTFLKENK